MWSCHNTTLRISLCTNPRSPCIARLKYVIHPFLHVLDQRGRDKSHFTPLPQHCSSHDGIPKLSRVFIVKSNRSCCERWLYPLRIGENGAVLPHFRSDVSCQVGLYASDTRVQCMSEMLCINAIRRLFDRSNLPLHFGVRLPRAMYAFTSH